MDWITLIVSLVSSIVTGCISYKKSTEQSKVKIKELETVIEQQRLVHQHELNLMQKKFEFSNAKSNDDMSSKLAEKFLTGELDLGKITKAMPDLMKLNKQARKLKD